MTAYRNIIGYLEDQGLVKDGTISVTLRYETPVEAKLEKRRLVHTQKHLRAAKRQIEAAADEIRAKHRNDRPGTLMSGLLGGLFGRRARGVYTSGYRASVISARDDELAPLMALKANLDDAILQIDALKLKIDAFVLKQDAA